MSERGVACPILANKAEIIATDWYLLSAMRSARMQSTCSGVGSNDVGTAAAALAGGADFGASRSTLTCPL